MVVFRYDGTLAGFLSAVFVAFSSRAFPESMLCGDEPAPLFARTVAVATDPVRSERVWQGLRKRLPGRAFSQFVYAWHARSAGCDDLLMRYVRKIFEGAPGQYLDYADRDMLATFRLARKVARERQFIIQFVRFQRTGDGTYYAGVRPLYDALPLALDYFVDRFADQRWLIYDVRRNYGFRHAEGKVEEIALADDEQALGEKLPEGMLSADEEEFQRLWRGYFEAIAIRERINPRLQRQLMPRRFWRQLPEME